jgi:hypothetical protein
VASAISVLRTARLTAGRWQDPYRTSRAYALGAGEPIHARQPTSESDAMSGSGSNIRVGALVGYAASRTMDQATTWFYASQSEDSKRREEELAPGGALVQLGKQLGAVVGRDLTDDEAGRVGLAVHRTLGVSYGMAASALVKKGVRPLVAGMVVGALAFVLVDEGTAISQLRDYPLESHLRGVVGHGAFGLAAGILLALIDER